MKRSLLAFLGILFTAVTFSAAAQTQTIRGSLFETTSLGPVTGAVIEVKGNGLNFSALSDTDGQFKISDLPLDLFHLHGYKDQCLAIQRN